MNSKSQVDARSAFTLFELLLVLAVVVALTAVILPALAKAKGGSRITCYNNLKQVGLAFRVWAGDNKDQFPMQVSTNEGGAMELCLAGDVLAIFRSMSNELSTPKVLLCPEDKQRHYGTNFGHGLQRGNISYFANITAKPALRLDQ